MEGLDFHIIRTIANYIKDRMSIIRWSWCSRTLNNLVTPCCHFRLTSEQTEVLYKAIQMDNIIWQSVFNSEDSVRRSFPNEYVISTGTSTGKTIMALVIATHYVKRGKKVMIIVDQKLSAQWIAEHKKFKNDLGLAPLTLVDHKWDMVYNPTHVLLVSKNIVSDRYGSRGEKARVLRNVLDPIKTSLDLFIMDEKSCVPVFGRNGFNGFGILLDASGKGAIANISIDPELGNVPTLHGHAIILGVTEIGSIFRVIPVSGTTRTVPYFNVDKTNIKEASEIYNMWCDKLCDGRTLIVTDDECSMSEGVNKFENIFNRITIRRTTHVFKKSHRSIDRSVIMEKFKTSDSGVLATRLSYIAKGFNIPCDTLIVFDLAGRTSQELALQVIGRVRRVQTGKTSVNVYIITTSPHLWKIIPAMIKTNTEDIQFFASQIGGFQAIKNAGVDIHRTDLSLESYSMTIHSHSSHSSQPFHPSHPSQPSHPSHPSHPSPDSVTYTSLGFTKFDSVCCPVDTYILRNREEKSFKVYLNYSFTLMKSNSTSVTQILVNNHDRVFIWSRWQSDSYLHKGMWCTSMEPFDVGGMQHAIHHFKKKFLKETGNEWGPSGKFVQQPGRSRFVGHLPDSNELGIDHVKTFTPLCLRKERITTPNQIIIAQKEMFIAPNDIFPSEAKSAIDASDRDRNARADHHLSFLIDIPNVPVNTSDKRECDDSDSDQSSKRVKL